MEYHLKEKLVKAKSAINTAWKNCFNNRYLSYSNKYRVFEAVSEAVMFYAAQIWGGKQYDSVEKLLRFFIKRIFNLPQNTPNYLLMLETGLSPLFIKTLKMQVDYVLKALDMPSNRLPRIAVMHTIHSKTSWYGEWLELAEGCGIALSEQDIGNWRPLLYELIEKVDEQFRQRYIEEALGSVHRVVYSQLDYNLGQKNYFHDNNKREEISMMLRLRGELLRLNYVPHCNDLPIICNLCNLQEREDVFHFLGRCPILREIRRNVLGFDFLTEEQMISLLNEMEVKKLFTYCKLSLNYRSSIINENF